MKCLFDFVDYPCSFSDPVAIIQTNKINEVLSCLQQVEDYTRAGYYAAGFVAYEASSAFDDCFETYSGKDFPLIYFGIFDHVQHRSVVASDISFSDIDKQWLPDTSQLEYRQAIHDIRQFIESGDTYQVNYTIRMHSDFTHDPYEYYKYLLGAQQSKYSAYLDNGEFQILSASPELFFHLKDGHIVTKPMKGTVARGMTNQQDTIHQAILHNQKNHAENLMITDLLRNDLARIAKQGSVKVQALFDAEKYPTIWQLTSTITADTEDSISLVDIFKALFPCGSITGAPKVNTMKIIKSLEKQPRGIYCGALGVITPERQMIFSVPIRTMMIHKEKATYGVGGGITYDSTAQDEYDEVIHKMKILYQYNVPEDLLESLLLQDGQYFLYDEHLKRLQDSAQYFDFAYHEVDIRKKLDILAQEHPHNMYKVRLLMNKMGHIQCDIVEIFPMNAQLSASWSSVSIQSNNVFLYHKTTRRDFYPKVTLDHEILLFNEKNEVTEFVNGNFVWYRDGEWLTPPLQSGLLNGTMRQHLLKCGQIKEHIIYKNDIQKDSQIAFINSVRGWRDVVWK